MPSYSETRRHLLQKLGLGLGAVSVLGVGAACASESEHDRREAVKQQNLGNKSASAPAAASSTMNHNSTAATSSTATAAAPAAQAMNPQTMDDETEKGVKYFLANAKGYTPNVMPFTMVGDTKEFKITAEAIKWEVSPDQKKDVFAYNGTLPGPEIRVTEGDKVRFVFSNKLPESTSIHWHGLKTPNAMDGVPFVTQKPVKPGETFTYEFVAAPVGSHMYHSHHNAMEQVGKGLLGAFIVEPRDKSRYPKFDKEWTMVLNDTLLGFTLNGKSFPSTQPMVVTQGERILVRYMNEGLMNHPMHLHGMPMQVVAKDGWLLPQPYMCDTLDVAPGDRYDVIIEAESAGAWAFHCHTLSHVEGPTGMFGLVTALVVQEKKA